MIKRVLIVSLMGVSLAGCVNNDSLSGDVYTASEAKQVQNVTYGTIVHVRPVQIQGGDDANVIGAIGGAVLGGFLGNTVGGGTGRSLATAAGAPRVWNWKSVRMMVIPSWWFRNRVRPSFQPASALLWLTTAARLPCLHANQIHVWSAPGHTSFFCFSPVTAAQ